MTIKELRDEWYKLNYQVLENNMSKDEAWIKIQPMIEQLSPEDKKLFQAIYKDIKDGKHGK